MGLVYVEQGTEEGAKANTGQKNERKGLIISCFVRQQSFPSGTGTVFFCRQDVCNCSMGLVQRLQRKEGRSDAATKQEEAVYNM